MQNPKPNKVFNENCPDNPIRKFLKHQYFFSRRNMLKLLLLGGLFVLPFGRILVRKKHNVVYSKEINIAINNYGYFRGEDLSKVLSETLIGPIEIQTLSIRNDGDSDTLTFYVLFDKKFSVNDTVDFYVEFYSSNDDIVGKVKKTLKHPDYVSPEWKSIDRRGTTKVQFVEIQLFPNMRLGDVAKMSLFVNTHENGNVN
jgi:hypothetical protein